MATYYSNDFRAGLKIMMDGEPYAVEASEFVKPGKGQAFARVKLRRLLTGMPFDEIAGQLGMSEKTVSNHQTQIRQKLGVGNAVELIHYARGHGLMP